MLILTRRVGETLMIGDNITVTILGVKGNQVRVGVDAPRDVSVHRQEIYERIQDEPPETAGPDSEAGSDAGSGGDDPSEDRHAGDPPASCNSAG